MTVEQLLKAIQDNRFDKKAEVLVSVKQADGTYIDRKVVSIEHDAAEQPVLFVEEHE